MPVERLAAALWGEEAAAGTGRTLQVYVSRLRNSLGERDRLVMRPAGYLLNVHADELDAERFERMVAEGCRALNVGQLERAASELREALALWRGPALAELATVWLAPAALPAWRSVAWSRWRRVSRRNSVSGGTPSLSPSCRGTSRSTRGVSGCTRS